jgi:acetyl-CoA carboxylase biotin carboxylase subunit
MEKYLTKPRHIEIQVLGDGQGNAVHLGERDCSLQRRHQKILEESPAPGLARAEIDALAAQVASVLQTLGYDNIGTVEMLRGADGSFSFLEMNTRLQVEHGVTEAVTGVDLVAAQIRVAAGERLAVVLPERIEARGHAMQARVYAEDPKRFLPSPGPLTVFRPPSDADVRIETGYREGQSVTPHYDPLLAKVIVHAPTRAEAIDRLAKALQAFEIAGVKHNIPALLGVLGFEPFRQGAVHTGLIAEMLGASNPARPA